LFVGGGNPAAEITDTLLGFETTSPRRCGPVCRGCGAGLGPGVFWGGVLVVALLWWWGVVFDLWIVVASI